MLTTGIGIVNTEPISLTHGGDGGITTFFCFFLILRKVDFKKCDNDKLNFVSKVLLANTTGNGVRTEYETNDS